MTEGRRIGDLLRAAGLITEAQLKSALDAQLAGGGRLGDVLVRQSLVSELQLSQISRTNSASRGSRSNTSTSPTNC